MTAWLDRIAYELLVAEHEVRLALRAITRHDAPPTVRTKGAGWRTVTMGIGEARALLHGAMPAPIALSKLRAPHAQLVAALEVFGRHLLAMNDPLHPPAVALAGAADLADALSTWTVTMRWRLASQKAGAKWPAPLDITPVTRLPLVEPAFPAHPLPCAHAGFAAAEYALRPAPRQLARAHQASLAHDHPDVGQVVDLRQADLPLGQPLARAGLG